MSNHSYQDSQCLDIILCGRLTGITNKDASATTLIRFAYAYDAAGRRTGSTTGGTTTAYRYDGNTVLLERQGGSVTASHTYGNALLRKDGETPLFDGLGSERTVTNSSGSGTGSLTLSAFGGTVTSSGTSASVCRFRATFGCRDDLKL